MRLCVLFCSRYLMTCFMKSPPYAFVIRACGVTDIDDHKTLCAIVSCVDAVGPACCEHNLFADKILRGPSPSGTFLLVVLQTIYQSLGTFPFIDNPETLNDIECCVTSAGRDTTFKVVFFFFFLPFADKILKGRPSSGDFMLVVSPFIYKTFRISRHLLCSLS